MKFWYVARGDIVRYFFQETGGYKTTLKMAEQALDPAVELRSYR